MLLPLWRVLTKRILSLPVSSVVGDDLGQGYTKGLGYEFCEKEPKEVGGREGKTGKKTKKKVRVTELILAP